MVGEMILFIYFFGSKNLLFSFNSAAIDAVIGYGKVVK